MVSFSNHQKNRQNTFSCETIDLYLTKISNTFQGDCKH